MNGVIRKISLSAQHADDHSVDYGGLNTDVIVQLDNGDEYVATFYSVKSLQGMMNEHMNSEQYKAKGFYKILDAVLINDLGNSDLLPVIENMIGEGDFQVVFKKV